MSEKNIRIGTRGSRLALWQAEWVKAQLESKGTHAEIIKIKTKGDKILDVPLAKVGGKGLFVKEIEEALIREEIDLAVHSMKDLPGEIPPELTIGAIPKREDPRDAVISRSGKPLADLPRGATVGTSSLRRASQLRALLPDLQILPLRGNLDTRLKKLKAGQFDAILLAVAGLRRLGWGDEITEILPQESVLPAIAQGALGIECRKDDIEIQEMILFLNHAETAIAVRAERAMLARLEGGCQVPIGGYAVSSAGQITLHGLVANLDGTVIIREVQTATRFEAYPLGVAVAESLLSKGAAPILKAIYDGV